MNNALLTPRIITHVRELDSHGRVNLPKALCESVGINRDEGLKTGMTDDRALIAMNPNEIEYFMEQIERNSECIDTKLRDQILFQYDTLLHSQTTAIDEKNRIIVPKFLRKTLNWEAKTELEIYGYSKKKQLFARPFEFKSNRSL